MKVGTVKSIREQLDATHVVVFMIDREGQYTVASHGDTEKDSHEAADAANRLKAYLGWPRELCRSKPLERICENCSFFTANRGTYCFNGWTGSYDGNCMLEPKPVRRGKTARACKQFEPKV